MKTPSPTNSVHILTERQRVAALKKELASASPTHGPGTPWRTEREAALARAEQGLARLEQFEAVLP